MIGIAFSLGFTVGPLMGAYFAISFKTAGTENVFHQAPALLALAFSIADLLFIWLMLPETVSKDAKVKCKNEIKFVIVIPIVDIVALLSIVPELLNLFQL